MNVTRVVRALAIAVLLAVVLGSVPAFASEPEVGDEVNLDGTIEKLVLYPDGTAKILIDGHKVLINLDTEIRGRLAVGAMAEVRAIVQGDGSLLALKIVVEDEVELEGTIEKLVLYPDGTGKIVIDGRKILINLDTEIRGRLAIGAMVEVKAIVHGDGLLLALKIVVED